MAKIETPTDGYTRAKLFYVAIESNLNYGHDEDPVMALSKAIGKVWDEKHAHDALRLIKVSFLDNDPGSKIEFLENGAYTTVGNVEAKHFDGKEVAEYINEVEKKELEDAER